MNLKNKVIGALLRKPTNKNNELSDNDNSTPEVLNFRKTKYARSKLLVFITATVLMVIFTNFVPEEARNSSETVLNEFSYGILLCFMVAIISFTQYITVRRIYNKGVIL